jgi:stage II sporulation protein R
MKKVICISVIIGILFASFPKIYVATEAAGQESIAGKVIRFHVIANSDDKKDQELKLKVRDAVLNYIYPVLQKSQNIGQSRNVLLKESGNIKKVAVDEIVKNGFNYSVKVMLSNENFPVKSYGNITLPQGRYEAFRIIIGRGEGMNWWCVMFPPLCFIDITKGEISEEKTEDEMKKVLTEGEYKMVDNKPAEKNLNDGILNTNEINGKKITVRFQLVETIKKYFHKETKKENPD